MIYIINFIFKMVSKLIKEQNNVRRCALAQKSFLLVFAIAIIAFNFFVNVTPIAAQNNDSISVSNLLQLHNDYRSSEGLSQLKLNFSLSQSAQQKAEAMIASDCWSHYCPDGKSPWDYFNDNNYDYILAGENLAEGFYSVNEIMDAWLESPSHKANIIKNGFNEIGFGVAYGNFQGRDNNVVVTVHFGSRPSQVDVEVVDGQITIKNPINGSVISSNSIEINGEAIGVNDVFVYNNDVFQGNASVNEGIFTFKISNLAQGNQVVNVESISNASLPIRSNYVNYFVDLQNTVSASNIVSETPSSFISISPGSKNIVNLAFVFILGLVFLLDFYIITRTRSIKPHQAFSHYHFSIFLIIGITILAGGVGGHIGNAINIA